MKFFFLQSMHQISRQGPAAGLRQFTFKIIRQTCERKTLLFSAADKDSSNIILGGIPFC
jgi:hypothetical protein